MRLLISLIFILTSSIVHSASHSGDFADLYEKHSKSVVTVYTTTISTKNGSPKASQGVGSGVLIEEDQILTAAHVVDGAHTIHVLFNDGERIRANVVTSLAASDIALLKLQHSHPAPTVACLLYTSDAADE